MTTIFPLPTSGRTSETLLYQRLITQTKSQESSLLRIQEQVSTGRRINRASEDPFAAARAISLQRLLEQNDQFLTNISLSSAYLGESETAIAAASDLLRDARGLAITGVDSTTTTEARDAIVDELRQILDRLVELGNKSSLGRYLFAGSDTTVQPYSFRNDSVVFNGNDGRLSSYVDLGTLISSSISGVEVFGGESVEVQSFADLNPVLSESTRLRDLNGGEGVSLGRIEITDGTNTSTIDISGAETVGDVVRLLESNPPFSRQIEVTIEADRLVVNLDTDSLGNLQINEVDGGQTARDLGILSPSNTGNSVDGTDLNPALVATTRLDEILGIRASVLLESAGVDNDLQITAREVGTQLNDYSFQYVDDDLLRASDGLTQGDEFVNFSATPVAAQAAVTFTGFGNNLTLTGATAGTSLNQVEIAVIDAGAIGNAAAVNFDAANGVLTIGVDNTGATEVQSVINAINAEGTFTAAHDASDSSDGSFDPTANINAADIGVVRGNTSNSGGDANTVFIHVDADGSTANDVIAAIEANSTVDQLFAVTLPDQDSNSGTNQGTGRIDPRVTGATANGSGTPLDVNSGILVQLGEESQVFDLVGLETVQDLLNRINTSDLPIHAEINQAADSIDLFSRASGVDFSIGENGGTTASQLGLRTFTEQTRFSELNYGRGVETADGVDFSIRRNDGSVIDIDLSNAQTIGDVLELVNSHPDNQDPNTQVVARLAQYGNGIEIVDDNPPSDATLAIVRGSLSRAAIDLGLIPEGQTEGYPSDSPPPLPATLDIEFGEPNHLNTSLTLTAGVPGTELNGVTVEFVSGTAVGDQALVNYDSGSKTLTIDIDPTATTTNTVRQAISLEGTYQATLDNDVDLGNNGSGLVPAAGNVGVTAGGSSESSAQPATATLQFAAPNDINTAFTITAAQGGTFYNDVEVVFQDTLAGDNANVTFDNINKRLIIDVDQVSTTTNTILAAIGAEGTFTAALDLSQDPTNDGSGVPSTSGSLATTSGGSPEVLVAKNVNPLESHSVFNSLTRLIDAFTGELDVEDAQRATDLLDQDLDRILNGLADVSTRQRSLADFEFQLDQQAIQLNASISQEVDVDLVEAISNLTQQQAVLESTLQVIGRIYQTSLLDFI